MFQLTGKRKFMVMLACLACQTFVVWSAIAKLQDVDFTALGILCGGFASGLVPFVWGNAQEHKCNVEKNGGS